MKRKRVAQLAVKILVGPTGIIVLAGVDTLCRKRRSSLFGVGMHHDPLISSRNKKLVSWGHDWVTVTLLVVNPWWAPSAVFALPICARLYRNRQEKAKAEQQQKKKKGATTKPTKKVVTRCRKQEQMKKRREGRHQRRVAMNARARRRTRRNAAPSGKRGSVFPASSPGRPTASDGRPWTTISLVCMPSSR